MEDCKEALKVSQSSLPITSNHLAVRGLCLVQVDLEIVWYPMTRELRTIAVSAVSLPVVCFCQL